MIMALKEDSDSVESHALMTAPPLVAAIMNWWLFGVLFMQYVLYLSHGTKRDRNITQAIVHFIFLLDTVQSILILRDILHWFVFNFGDYEPLGLSGLTGVDGPILDCIIALTVQCFYCWRIWIIGKRKVFPIMIALLALTSAVGGIVGGVYEAANTFVISTEIHRWYIPGMIWLWVGVATDIFIAVTMIYLLKFKFKNCSEGLRVVIKRLLILTFETNALTAMVLLLTAILGQFPSLEPPATNLHRLTSYNIGKLYSNCFMVLLNQRIYYEKSPREETSTNGFGKMEFAPSGSELYPGTLTNPDMTGEVSVIQFPEAVTRVGFRSGHTSSSGDIELGKRT